MASRFVPNPVGIAGLLRDPALRRYVERATETLRQTAQSGSPRDTGHFADSYETAVETTSAGPVGLLDNTDAGAVAIEFGSVNNPPFAPMRRACRALGLRLRGER